MKSSCKIYASVISMDSDGTHFVEVEPKLLIPLSYTGWFQLISNTSTPLPSLRRVADVVKADITDFVVTRPFTAFRFKKRLADSLQAVDIDTGQMLTTNSVLTDWLSDESLTCLCMRRRGQRREDSCYLKTCDGSGVQLLLPYDAEGDFLEVGRCTDVGRTDVVYQLADVVRCLQLPIDVHLICGQLPHAIAGSGSLFRLKQLVLDSDVTIRSDKMVEFPENTDLTGCRTWDSLLLTKPTAECEKPKDSVNTELDRQKTTQESSPLKEKTESNDCTKATTHEDRLPEKTSVKEDCTRTHEHKQNTASGQLAQSNDNDREVCTPIGCPSGSHDHVIVDHNCPPAAHQLDNGCASAARRSLPPTPVLPVTVKPKKTKAWYWAKNMITKYRKVSSSPVMMTSADYEVIPFCLKKDGATESVDLVQEQLAEEEIEDEKEARKDRVLIKPPIVHVTGARDEDGYLLPVEVRPTANNTYDNAAYQTNSTGFSVRASKYGCPSTRMNKYDTGHNFERHEIAVPRKAISRTSSVTSGTLSRCPSCSYYSTRRSQIPDQFHNDRLQAFLTDSIDQLKRRQLPDPRLTYATNHDHPDMTEGIEAFLDRIFDCDSMSDSPDSNVASIHNQDVEETTSTARLDQSPRRYQNDTRSRRYLDCSGYQTIDSGIWLSPPRLDRDSVTYRSSSDCSWMPPDDLEQLTVEEVGLSLRYIGIKDSIVSRFCEQQIDGKQLTELTDELIQEGFPELNALEKKKLTDFIRGWRPKKWASAATE